MKQITRGEETKSITKGRGGKALKQREGLKRKERSCWSDYHVDAEEEEECHESEEKRPSK